MQIDGVTVNAFGGAFDFAHIPADWLERVEVVRGPQSAVYGAYANSGRGQHGHAAPRRRRPRSTSRPRAAATSERRFAAGGGGTLRGLRDFRAPPPGWTRRPRCQHRLPQSERCAGRHRNFARQGFGAHGHFNSNEAGAPGPWGSNPLGLFTGLDRVSRNRNNFSNYLARY